MAKNEKLIIGQKTKQPLNKNQQTFNKLVKKLEKLRLSQEKIEKLLGEKLDFYGKNIYPLEEKLAGLHSRSAKIFYQFYLEQKTLTTTERETLTEIIAAQMDGFHRFSREPLDDELKKIFEFLEGESFESAAAADFEAMKDDMSATFKEMGFDVDLNDFDAGLSEEEMMRKLAEILGDVKDQAETKAAEEPKRKKTKKQIEKEEREKQIEDAKNKNIASIYKQLARVFHPDLEQHAERKTEKENLMKQLTNAYEKGDLHTLLRLELEWLNREEHELDKLSDEKLKIYNQALKEQIEDLEDEIYLSSQHPRYAPLQKYVRFFTLDTVDLPSEQEALQNKINWLEGNLAQFDGDAPLKQLRETLRIAKKELKKQRLFSVNFEDFFG